MGSKTRQKTIMGLGEYHLHFPGIKKDEQEFRRYLRMSVTTFDYILNKVQSLLMKNYTNWHKKRIYPEERLVITLRFLAAGLDYPSLHFSFGHGVSTISEIVLDCLEVLLITLTPLHMPMPSQEDFERVADEFYEKCNFPHIVGAIDGRHVRIKKPANSGSLFYNYKRFFSIVQQSVVDANYKYLMVDVALYGSQSDGAIFNTSKFKEKLDTGKITLPDERELPESDIVAPFFFVGDGAYPLRKDLMKPFRGIHLTDEQTTFNKRLSRARVVVENAFGRTVSQWRIYRKLIELDPKNVQKIVLVTCVLQNVLLDLEGDEFMKNLPPVDVSEICMDETEENDEVVNEARNVREKLIEYLSYA
ncbi:hypothetical protein TKK_0009522 [Trichogramma kaykai]|uniref:DDE Tnp4 domain-containing protein n=1 Tax=Trichogramma kaykai TaxID=54128 RepID=A0ABD2X0Y5_9HYME